MWPTLVEVGEVDAERLRRERSTRHIVERVFSQIVELAGSINTHIVASLLGRSPESYAGRPKPASDQRECLGARHLLSTVVR